MMRFLIGQICGMLLILFVPSLITADEVSSSPDLKPSSESSFTETPISDADRDHWSFLPLATAKPPIPKAAAGQTWVRNPIDQFIWRKLEENALVPQSPASRASLIRRVTFDLTGLPPAPNEVSHFLRDRTPNAYERLVDRLLGSPRHGEHVAQSWLDLARFAETDGFEHDKIRKEAWRYRDWVIAAVDHDMSYDQFVQLQIAGDTLEGDRDAARIATAFCLSGPDMPDINSMEERKHDVLNELTGTVGSVFLGLQLGCAQCHDHRVDPISQADFYRLRAIFASAVNLRKNQSLFVLDERNGTPSPQFVHVRGDWQRRGPIVEAAVPRVLNQQNIQIASRASESAEQSRVRLARWLTRNDNTLVQRVIVNRIWQQHFGRGLSTSPSDFGLVGDEPSHPELLDWLAAHLVRNDWSLKKLRRTILLSATYRQASRESRSHRSSTIDKSNASLPIGQLKSSLERDASNRLLSRGTRRRLSGEAIRDAMLYVSGGLNFQQGGAGVRPPLPSELVKTLLKNQWKVTPDIAQHYRRSIYIFARRNLRYPIFQAFDRPSANASCPDRTRSTTAPQSLLLFNSEFSLECAGRMAELIMTQKSSSLEGYMQAAFQRTIGRQPTREELTVSNRFAADQSQLADNREEIEHTVLTQYCLALFNSNEFIYID